MSQYFEGLDYNSYCIQEGINSLPGIEINLDNYGDITRKTDKKWETIDPSNQVASPPELDDLIRLHFLVRKRRVRTIMEFGLGKSTSVFLDAISKNKMEFEIEVREKLRCSNAFEVHSVDNNAGWLAHTTNIHQENKLFHPHLCPVEVSTFNDRMCTYYHNLPNIRPDFIYLDGPDQFSAGSSIRGLTTAHPDRMPMAADILVIEHFLEPSTLILVDGRTANARFLKANFQRNWKYTYFSDFDQHIFELDEEPLGKWNQRAIAFTKDKI